MNQASEMEQDLLQQYNSYTSHALTTTKPPYNTYT